MAAALGSDSTTGDGRHAVAPLSAVGPVPVGIICVPLLDRAADTIESRRLRGSEAVSALMARPRVATLVEGEFSAAVFRLCSAIAGQLPVWEVRGPWGSVEPDLGRRLRVALTPLMGDEGHNAA